MLGIMGTPRVLVLFGGRSGEHEVSVTSAQLVTRSVLELGWQAVPVGIARSGRWVRCDPRQVTVVPERGEVFTLSADPTVPRDVDVAFPVLHGPHGEDGTVQGLFELADLPYVGAGVEGSAIGTNKVLHKRLFQMAGLPVVDFVAFTRDEWRSEPGRFADEVAKLDYPCFAKPARLGSSVGISKVHHEGELAGAVERALRHDDLVLIEAAAGPAEVEIAALEGEREGEVDLSVVGQIVPAAEFYDYRAKYRNDATELRIPAPVPTQVEARVRELAGRAFRAAGCAGMARIDFFWTPDDDRLVVNEINTIPGMTPASMFPRLWAGSGVEFSDVVRRLVERALTRHERKRRLEDERAASHQQEIA